MRDGRLENGTKEDFGGCVIVTDSRDEEDGIGALGEKGSQNESCARERDGSG